jgi:hypothetical protein
MGEPTLLTSDALLKMQSDYFMQFLLDNSKFLEEIYHKLKGETLSEELKEIDGQKVMIPVWSNKLSLKPMINEDGLNITMNILNLSLTTNNATGKMDDNVLRTLAFKTYGLLLKEYMLNLREFGFKDYNDAYTLSHQIFINILMHLSKSTDMALLKEFSRSYSIQEVRANPLKKEKEMEMTI